MIFLMIPVIMTGICLCNVHLQLVVYAQSLHESPGDSFGDGGVCGDGQHVLITAAKPAHVHARQGLDGHCTSKVQSFPTM